VVTEDPQAAAREATAIVAAREARIRFLSEQQAVIAEANRQEAARQQAKFGEGNQG
jgi:hypothetical protein